MSFLRHGFPSCTRNICFLTRETMGIWRYQFLFLLEEGEYLRSANLLVFIGWIQAKNSKSYPTLTHRKTIVLVSFRCELTVQLRRVSIGLCASPNIKPVRLDESDVCCWSTWLRMSTRFIILWFQCFQKYHCNSQGSMFLRFDFPRVWCPPLIDAVQVKSFVKSFTALHQEFAVDF